MFIKTKIMKHLFVPYELALLAKEKGFNEPCLRHYNVGHNKDGPIRLSMFKNEQMGSVSAPLYQQLVDFFREKHNKDIHVWHHENGVAGNIWTWVINNIETGLYEAENDCSDYYEALNKALEEAFKLI